MAKKETMKEISIKVEGMTLLDYFAAQYISCYSTGIQGTSRENIAAEAYYYAEAMMKERKKHTI
jgi:hypothetical protein